RIPELLIILSSFLVLPLYFLPSIIAFSRNVELRHLILALNFFLGWTFLGWVISLAMSLTVSPEHPRFVAAPIVGPSPPPTGRISDTLAELAGLKDRGLISEEEFQAKRSDILSRL
ncbi:MAG: superinfection immunity protein, partial [Tepidiformaceae bacterium]